MTTLRAASGLELHLEPGTRGRIAWGEPDWLGPVFAGGGDAASAAVVVAEADGSDDMGAFRSLEIACTDPRLRTFVRAYHDRPLLVFRCAAATAIDSGLATGSFARPRLAWPALRPTQRSAAGAPDGLTTYGHQFCEFALPVFGDANAAGFLVHPERPRVFVPLAFLAADGRTLLLAPLDAFHEQVIAVDETADGTHIDCGWHGDLEAVPAGFATELAVWAAAGPRQALDEWSALLRRRNGTRRPSRYADVGVGRLSYWTDNGAAYYYRPHPGLDMTATLRAAVDDLRERDVPIASVQIDSWFYPHRHPRAVGAEGAPVVPPSGMLLWEPRADVFPDGFAGLADAVGGLPLTFHSRHVSADSPYAGFFDSWTDGPYAHPADPRFFAMLMDQAHAWGAITYEQDWLVESFLGVRGLRAAPGRARAWQEAMDSAARERGMTLQWCMGTPADFLQTVTLTQVTSIRTSGDYRYMFDNGLNWVWFLHGNAWARALGLHPFKDVLLTHGATDLGPGEPYAEIEMLLAALSAGPVAIGDEIGRTDRNLVLRACREDGVLVKPDVPIAAIDRCFRSNAYTGTTPLVGETQSTHPAGVWRYVATFNAGAARAEQDARVDLRDVAPAATPGHVFVVDWRRRTWFECDGDGGWSCRFGFQDWDYRVVCPALAGGAAAVFGDLGRYATVGDRLISAVEVRQRTVRFAVHDRPGAVVRVWGFSRNPPRAIRLSTPTGSRMPEASAGEAWAWSADDGGWQLAVRVDAGGHTRVEIELA